jgi:hypothetical protein
MLVSVMPELKLAQQFLHCFLDDLQLINGVKNTIMDKTTIAVRSLCEGMGFFTKTLPKLGKALDSALATGKYQLPTNFRRYRNTALPSFTRGLLARVFDLEGNILPNVDVAAVTELRQLYYAFYKYVTPFTERQQVEASKKFCETDDAVGKAMSNITKLSPLHTRALEKAKEFWDFLFQDFDPYSIVPTHGPGIVSTGERPHEKRFFDTHYADIHRVYPYYRYLYMHTNHLKDTVNVYFERKRLAHGSNKVLFVPKDSRGPRTIACEPLVYQYLQGGLRRALYTWIENHPSTKEYIRFTDQSVNQRLAYMASTCKPHLATVDLKDASDSVGNVLIKYLSKDTCLYRPLQALRTPASVLPTGEEKVLNKYAAMGSALCFPIEAITFFSLIHGFISASDYVSPHGEPYPYVYGDDLIFDSDLYPGVATFFRSLGLQVNHDKSFLSTSPFKESCGHDYFKGNLVTYIKVRTLETSTPAGLASCVSLSNQLFEKGYYKTSQLVETLCKKQIAVPVGPIDAGFLCFSSSRYSGPFPVKGLRRRYNKRLQYYEYLRPVLTGVKYETENYQSSSRQSSHTLATSYAEYQRKMTNGWSEHFRAGWYNKRTVKLSWKFIPLLGASP